MNNALYLQVTVVGLSSANVVRKKGKDFLPFSHILFQVVQLNDRINTDMLILIWTAFKDTTFLFTFGTLNSSISLTVHAFY